VAKRQHGLQSPRLALLTAIGTLSLAPQARAQETTQEPADDSSVQVELGSLDDTERAASLETATHAPKTKNDDGRGLVLLPVVVSDPLLGLGLGTAGIYTFQLDETGQARSSFISASALVTTNKQFKLALTHNIELPEERIVLRGRLLLKIFSEDYWGIGNDTPDSHQRSLSYNSIDYLGRVNIATKHDHWYVGPLIRANYTWDSSLQEPYPPPELAGDNLKDFMMLGIGLSVVYDDRDALENPTRGYFVSLELIDLPSEIPKAYGNTVGAIEATADIRGFWKPNADWDQVLAARIHANVTHGRVPFPMLPTPGREEKLRGHLEGRLRDYHLAGIDLEYRVRWWRRLGTTVFAGWGFLFGNPGDKITWKTMPKSAGFGLRYMVQEADRLNLRLDVGWDFRGNNAVIFEAGEAF
jgi:outer membrane protein assembly factor BamA